MNDLYDSGDSVEFSEFYWLLVKRVVFGFVSRRCKLLVIKLQDWFLMLITLISEYAIRWKQLTTYFNEVI